MYKKLIIGLMALSLFALTGCKKETSQNKATDEKSVVGTDNNNAQVPNAKPQVDPEKLARDKARSQQLLAEGRMLPPRAEIAFKAGKIDGNLSVEDAERSYIFRRSAVRRCYMNELAYNSDAKGEVKTTLRFEAQQKAAVVDYTSAIDSEDFNKCMKEAVATWPLPEGVTLEAILNFSSTPAPTLQQIRESNRGLHDHNHDHGHNGMDHEHHNHDGMDHEHHDHDGMEHDVLAPVPALAQ